MSTKACCVTGHREIPADKVEYVKAKLKEEIEKAIADGFTTCFAGCDGVKVQQDEYSSDCFMNRNRYLVSLSSRVIAVYDGRDSGGTLFTMRYAHTMEREVREIRI